MGRVVKQCGIIKIVKTCQLKIMLKCTFALGLLVKMACPPDSVRSYPRASLACGPWHPTAPVPLRHGIFSRNPRAKVDIISRHCVEGKHDD